jgi:hypothetical protein
MRGLVSFVLRFVGIWMDMWTNVERERRIEVDRRGIRRFDLEAAWDEDDGKTHPESSVRRQSSATKDVS